MIAVTLSGRAVTRRELLGYPDTPITVGTVIVVPEENIGDLWALVGLSPPTRSQLALLQFHIERPALESLSAVTAAINLDGSFDLALAPGPHLFCLSGIFTHHAVGGLEVAGCAQGVIAAEPAFLSLTYGEGGVQLIGPP